MRTEAAERPTVLACVAAGLGTMLPWCALLLGVKALLFFQWPSDEHLDAPSWWAWWVASDVGFILPFLLFAAGVRLARVMGYSRRLLPTAIGLALAVGAVSYYLAAWGAPELERRYWDTMGDETLEQRAFGAATPPGILRNLRAVEDSPPTEFSLRAAAPSQTPPNVLRWYLHLPAAMAVFGLINTLAGVFAAQVTEDFSRGARRNVLLALGVLGGLVSFGVLAMAGPIEPFLRDGNHAVRNSGRVDSIGRSPPAVCSAIQHRAQALCMSDGSRGCCQKGDADAGIEISAFQSGDLDALNHLLKHFSPLIERVIASYVYDSADRDELFEMVSVRIWSRRMQFAGRGSLGGWINKVANSVCCNWANARKTRRKHEARYAAEVVSMNGAHDPDDPAENAAKSEFMAKLRHSLAQLPTRQGDTFLLKYHEGYSDAEVAKIQGVRPATVRSNLRHAKKKLRVMMEDYRE